MSEGGSLTKYHRDLGAAALNFRESDLGGAIFDLARRYADQTVDAIAEVDPTNMVELIRLQERIKLARLFPVWFDELIENGIEAQAQLTMEGRAHE